MVESRSPALRRCCGPQTADDVADGMVRLRVTVVVTAGAAGLGNGEAHVVEVVINGPRQHDRVGAVRVLA